MKTRYYTKSRTLQAEGYTYQLDEELLRLEWRNSPRGPDGKLLLRGNPMSRYKDTVKSFRYSDAGGIALSPARSEAGRHPRTVYPTQWEETQAALYSNAYARLRGKLYKGNASLGITLASYKQSASMINSRFLVLNNKAARGLLRLTRLSKSDRAKMLRAETVRQLPRAAANFYLEMIFGWAPLVKDIHAAGHALSSIKPDYQTVKAAQRTSVNWAGEHPFGTHSFDGEMRVVLATGVWIDNPHTWMLERLGLLNIGAVAWDLVPWSFVVNMFVNTGVLFNSLTDFAGLRFDEDGTFTTAAKGVGRANVDFYGSTSEATWISYPCYRTLLPRLPKPGLVFRLPDDNLRNAALGAALFTQKVEKLVHFFNPHLRP